VSSAPQGATFDPALGPGGNSGHFRKARRCIRLRSEAAGRSVLAAVISGTCHSAPPARDTAVRGSAFCAARYSPNLSRRCTHLIVTSTDEPHSDKLRTALAQQSNWGIKIQEAAEVLSKPVLTVAAPARPRAGAGVGVPASSDSPWGDEERVQQPQAQAQQAPWMVHFSQLPLDGVYAENHQRDGSQRSSDNGSGGATACEQHALLPLLEEQWADEWAMSGSAPRPRAQHCTEHKLEPQPWQLRLWKPESATDDPMILQQGGAPQPVPPLQQQHSELPSEQLHQAQQAQHVDGSQASQGQPSLGDWHRQQEPRQSLPASRRSPHTPISEQRSALTMCGELLFRPVGEQLPTATEATQAACIACANTAISPNICRKHRRIKLGGSKTSCPRHRRQHQCTSFHY
jgi:hypothetical protein